MPRDTKYYARIALLLALVTALASCVSETRQTIPDREHWQVRDPGTPASGGAEQLAVEVVRKGLKPVQWGTAKGYLEYEDQGSAVVVVESIPRSAPGMLKRVRYKVRDELILAESYPNYIPIVDKVREGYAREAATLLRDGRSPQPPPIYDMRFIYLPQQVDDCVYSVEEYDIERRPLETYQIDLCDGKR